jgi:hypothetical protein
MNERELKLRHHELNVRLEEIKVRDVKLALDQG